MLLTRLAIDAASSTYRIVLAPLYSYTGTSIVISEMQRLVDR